MPVVICVCEVQTHAGRNALMWHLMRTSQDSCRLQGLPKSHVICQDAIQATIPQERQPIDTLLLVRPQLQTSLDWCFEGLDL